MAEGGPVACGAGLLASGRWHRVALAHRAPVQDAGGSVDGETRVRAAAELGRSRVALPGRRSREAGPLRRARQGLAGPRRARHPLPGAQDRPCARPPLLLLPGALPGRRRVPLRPPALRCLRPPRRRLGAEPRAAAGGHGRLHQVHRRCALVGEARALGLPRGPRLALARGAGDARSYHGRHLLLDARPLGRGAGARRRGARPCGGGRPARGLGGGGRGRAGGSGRGPGGRLGRHAGRRGVVVEWAELHRGRSGVRLSLAAPAEGRGAAGASRWVSARAAQGGPEGQEGEGRRGGAHGDPDPSAIQARRRARARRHGDGVRGAPGRP
mmetsp:Transcript_53047/g.152890  ORF Transcript_53047/g.152890 Transcript_53047/m.152890 type:complete len:327 (+) Transcript_53047:1689-2669(+)